MGLIHLERCDVVDYWMDHDNQIYWSMVNDPNERIYGPFKDEGDAYWDALNKFGLWTV